MHHPLILDVWGWLGWGHHQPLPSHPELFDCPPAFPSYLSLGFAVSFLVFRIYLQMLRVSPRRWVEEAVLPSPPGQTFAEGLT